MNATALVPPIAQPPEYTVFVDQRTWLGIPNAFDVLSNVAFAVVGVLGLAATLTRQRGSFAAPWDRWPYVVLFTGVALSSLGSSYFHLAPDNARLMWDRLPMTTGLTAYAAAKGLELADRAVFTALGHTLSGHTLKHLVAAGGVGCLVGMLQRRATPAGSETS